MDLHGWHSLIPAIQPEKSAGSQAAAIRPAALLPQTETHECRALDRQPYHRLPTQHIPLLLASRREPAKSWPQTYGRVLAQPRACWRKGRPLRPAAAPYQRLAPSRRTGGGAQRSRRGAPTAPRRAPASRAGAASPPRAPEPSSPPGGAAPRRLGGCQRSPPPPPTGRGAGGPGSSRRGGAGGGGASSRRPPPGRQRSAAGAARSPRGGSARQRTGPISLVPEPHRGLGMLTAPSCWPCWPATCRGTCCNQGALRETGTGH